MPASQDIRVPNLPTITPFHDASLGALTRYLAGTAAASTTLGSQIAQFFPWLLETPATIVKGFTLNGASTNGNMDVGVYDHEFNRIVSMGATAQSGTSAIQTYDITDTLLIPGRYWIAIVCSGTGTIFCRSGADELILSAFSLLEMTGQTSLPATATPAKSTAATPVIPIFGFSTEVTV